ncbi:hypothetical protein [Methanococcus maripaludis]|uniref:Uncharacterized protein n=1 Tax=Methanococcus maripaludis TaxID=39152 RepID=A0A7J9PL59_METMI|nr:hypothetical protein [Methanococcus maripaludis]MBA2864003.1 hypothetical protein [Methanococcus maripaludis]
MENAKTAGVIHNALSLRVMEYSDEVTTFRLIGLSKLTPSEYFQLVRKTISLFSVFKSKIKKAQLTPTELITFKIFENQGVTEIEPVDFNYMKYQIIEISSGGNTYKLMHPQEKHICRLGERVDESTLIPNTEHILRMADIILKTALDIGVLGFYATLSPELLRKK